MPTSSNAKRLQRIVEEYREAGMKWPATAFDIATWANKHGLLEPSARDIINLCTDQISRAMQEEYHTDPQGREVRTKVSRRVLLDGRQQSLWGDIRDEPRPFVHAALQQRRRGIASDCIRLSTDLKSVNENRWPDNPIQLSFDFRADVSEAEALERLNQRDAVTAYERADEPLPAYVRA